MFTFFFYFSNFQGFYSECALFSFKSEKAVIYRYAFLFSQQIFFLTWTFFFFWPDHAACGILVP